MWSRRSIEIIAGVALLAVLAACAVNPKRATQFAPTATAAAPAAVAGKSAAAGKAAQPGTAAAVRAATAPPPIPAEAQDEFNRAQALARAGSDAAAEAQLASLAQQYAQFCTPLVDLGILYRKDGDLDAATQALQQAVAHDPHSALAWTELGVTQRLGGKFQAAEQSYGRAIAADPTYAPVYRDRGVLRDLYLDEPAAALGDFEQYRKLAGADKLAAMWVAELQHRTGIKDPPNGQRPTATAGVAVPSPPQASTTPTPQPQGKN